MAMNGVEMMMKAVVGKETMEEIQRFANNGSLQRLLGYFDKLDKMQATLARIEERLDGDGYSNVPCPRCGFCTCGPGPKRLLEANGDDRRSTGVGVAGSFLDDYRSGVEGKA
jgi:hypothetical protein